MIAGQAVRPLHYDVVVVGAGMSGLVAASTLQTRGRRVLVLEKSRGVGGRMATRRIGSAVFDHGAQFFTVRHADFAAILSSIASAYRPWGEGFQNAKGELPPEHQEPRFCGAAGMTSIPKALSEGLDLRLGEEVSQIELAKTGGWLVQAKSGLPFQAAKVILTCPVPQTLAVLPKEGLEQEFMTALSHVNYAPCFALMIIPQGKVDLPSPGAVKIKGDVIDWLADNQAKGISSYSALTCHASESCSQHYLEDGPLTPKTAIDVQELMLAALKPWLRQRPKEMYLHRWRYATPKVAFDQQGVPVTECRGIYICGDAFCNGRVEGAALSGYKAALHILSSGTT